MPESRLPKHKAWLRIFRVKAFAGFCGFAIGGVLAAYKSSANNNGNYNLYPSIVAVLLLSCTSLAWYNMFNDIMDYEIDKKSVDGFLKHPLVNGSLSFIECWSFLLISLISCHFVLLKYYFVPKTYLSFMISVIAAIIYNTTHKKIVKTPVIFLMDTIVSLPICMQLLVGYYCFMEMNAISNYDIFSADNAQFILLFVYTIVMGYKSNFVSHSRDIDNDIKHNVHTPPIALNVCYRKNKLSFSKEALYYLYVIETVHASLLFAILFQLYTAGNYVLCALILIIFLRLAYGFSKYITPNSVSVDQVKDLWTLHAFLFHVVFLIIITSEFAYFSFIWYFVNVSTLVIPVVISNILKI
eukprot:138354_1